ncbi:hypothetical protein [Microbacterium galbinum]|uniref:hypothetical protein n=1 Tax=Microbacterium galbinum TaxID=2851646 RepID=UPI001FFD4FB4|nr:hypothetical protein [Microbacterium galbinum]MCK2031253.1 hypothetical protein [Microbacterium galbinum]
MDNFSAVWTGTVAGIIAGIIVLAVGWIVKQVWDNRGVRMGREWTLTESEDGSLLLKRTSRRTAWMVDWRITDDTGMEVTSSATSVNPNGDFKQGDAFWVPAAATGHMFTLWYVDKTKRGITYMLKHAENTKNLVSVG